MIQNIDVSRLHPHPDNPRKELGDLTELAESIKVSGVLQNLTVVPLEGAPDEYRVIIGHRRLAAAKLAELTELPCAISGMNLREQVATMLLENMQRSDLTVYEQAQGFQMMLDLGDTLTDIAERTGFSFSTVRRRIKLLELDQEKLKASAARGATLADYAELEKIRDPERKNAVLDKIGTPNFNNELQRAIDAEKEEERIAELIEALSAFATQVDSEDEYKRVKYFYPGEKFKMERPEDADATEYFFTVLSYGAVCLLKKAEDSDQEEDNEAARREERKQWRISKLSEATARAYTLRREFIQNAPAAKIKKNLSDVVTAALWKNLSTYCTINKESFLNMIDSQVNHDNISHEELHTAVAKCPERALLTMAYLLQNDRANLSYFHWGTGEHTANDNLDRIYDLIIKLGYEISDEERALQDGTHELFNEDDKENE